MYYWGMHLNAALLKLYMSLYTDDVEAGLTEVTMKRIPTLLFVYLTL